MVRRCMTSGGEQQRSRIVRGAATRRKVTPCSGRSRALQEAVGATRSSFRRPTQPQPQQQQARSSSHGPDHLAQRTSSVRLEPSSQRTMLLWSCPRTTQGLKS